jgi:hypothetical protein
MGGTGRLGGIREEKRREKRRVYIPDSSIK